MSVGRAIGATGKAGRRAVGVPLGAGSNGPQMVRASFLLIGAGGGNGGSNGGAGALGGTSVPVAFDMMVPLGIFVDAVIGGAGLNGQDGYGSGTFVGGQPKPYTGSLFPEGRGSPGANGYDVWNGSGVDTFGGGGAGGNATALFINGVRIAHSGGAGGGGGGRSANSAPTSGQPAPATAGTLPSTAGSGDGSGGGGGYGGIGGSAYQAGGTAGVNGLPKDALPYTGPPASNYASTYGGPGKDGALVVSIEGTTLVYPYSATDQMIPIARRQ